MRHIHKGEPDQKLSKRHGRPPASAEEARTGWRNFRGQRKAATYDKCLMEQCGLCAYSEVALPAETAELQRLGSHLEHIEPRSENWAKTFDHSNLVVSAIGDEQLRELAAEDVFGGHARGNWWNPEAFIHPLMVDCRGYFHFSSDGRIVPTAALSRRERAKARLTVYKLNLNAPILVNWRKTRLDKKRALLSSLMSVSGTDFTQLKQLAREELLPGEDGMLKPFHSATRQLFGRIGEEVVAESTGV